MTVLQSHLMWEECVDEDVCIKVFGDNQCVNVQVCVRLIYESSGYYIEVEAYGERWKWSLTKACYDFWEYGIARLRLCASPVGDSGAKIVLEACLGVASVSKCWVLLAEDVVWSIDANIQPNDLKQMMGRGNREAVTAKRLGQSSAIVAASSRLSPSEANEVLATPPLETTKN